MLPCWKGSHVAFEEIRDFCGANLVKSAMKTGCGMIWTHWGPSATTMPIYGLPLRATPIFHNNNFDVVMSIYRWFHVQDMRIVPLSIVFSDEVCRHHSGHSSMILCDNVVKLLPPLGSGPQFALCFPDLDRKWITFREIKRKNSKKFCDDLVRCISKYNYDLK